MRSNRMLRPFLFLFLFVLALAATGAAAEYPERPIRLVVPQAAGSATDNIARLVAPEMAKILGQAAR